ncbi:MAG: type II secretion system F family protein [Synergistaceae bacterium]|nr:type II secretion system F family protein [Synergistaceae bacterium]
MPYYNYTGYDAEGKLKKGVLEASSSAQAIDRLTERAIIVVDVEQSTERGKSRKVVPLSLEGHIMFCKSLASYLRSGLPLADALKVLGKQTTDKKIGAAYSVVLEGIEGGKKFHAALQECGAFRETLSRIVESGEQSGSLIHVLEQVSEQFRLEDRLLKRIKKALTYPIAMIIIGTGVVAFLLTYVVPKIAVLFEEVGQTLPLPTRILIALSNFVANWGLAIVLTVCLVLFIMRRRGKRIPLPFMKGLRGRLTLSLVMSHLATLLRSGIPLVQALKMASVMDTNPARWMEASDLVKAGHRFDRALEKLGFTEDVIYVIRVGEMGGDLTTALSNVGETNWEIAESQMDRLATLIEPVMTLTLGFSVGFIVVSILLPVFDISGLVK